MSVMDRFKRNSFVKTTDDGVAFVHGVGADPHDNWRRQVVYTSDRHYDDVPPFDFMLGGDVEFDRQLATRRQHDTWSADTAWYDPRDLVVRGFYRHHKGHVYYVHGVGMDPRDHWRRKVVYTSVKTETIGELDQPPYDFVLRYEKHFSEWIYAETGATACGIRANSPEERRTQRILVSGLPVVPRFALITDPGMSKFN